MKRHLANAAYGTLDYLAYPAGMIVLAPAICRELGIDRFGIWTLANTVLVTGAVLASGFGDANIRYVSQARGNAERENLLQTVRGTLGIHLVLGLLLAAAVWVTAPLLTHSVVKSHAELTGVCLWSLRITAALILLRALETVCVSSQRAFERYGAAVQVSAGVRVLSLLAAWLVPVFDKSVVAIMVAALMAALVGLCIQFAQLHRTLRVRWLTPSLRTPLLPALLEFGAFTWLQAAAGLLVGQVDRLVTGAALGTTALTVYAFCVQLAQPIYGVSAAGLHFIFPLLASRERGIERRQVSVAFAANALFVLTALAILLLFGEPILRLWAGNAIASAAAGVLPVVVWGTALAALSVTGCYALLAINRPRVSAMFNVSGGLAMTAALILLTPRYGLMGIAYSRILPGAIALFVYVPLIRQLTRRADPKKEVNALALLGKA